LVVVVVGSAVVSFAVTIVVLIFELAVVVTLHVLADGVVCVATARRRTPA